MNICRDGFMPSLLYCAAVCVKSMKEFFKGVWSDFSHWNTKMLCRAGVVAALYVVLTWALGPVAFGVFQIRPAEALTVLPLFFPETIPALYIGCILANFVSQYGVYDIFLGSLATLIAACGTYFTGKLIKNNILRLAVGGVFPVILNAFIVPAVWILAGTSDVVYWYEFAVMILNEAIWVYALGIPLYIAVLKLRQRGVRVFTSPVHSPQAAKRPRGGQAVSGAGMPSQIDADCNLNDNNNE